MKTKFLNNKFKFLIATIALSTAIIIWAGVTLAVTTDSNGSGGALTSANLSLSSSISGLKVYCAVPADETDGDVFYDENNSPYKHELSLGGGDEKKVNFSRHDGSVTYNEKSINIDKIMPGDKVEFDIEVKSIGNISFDYRAELYVDATGGETLLNELDFTAGQLGILRKQLPEGDSQADGETLAPAVITDYTEWRSVSGMQSDVEKIHVTVSLPITATKGGGESVNFYYVARGVQLGEVQDTVVAFNTPDGEVKFSTLKEGVEYAIANDITEIPVVGSTILEEGEIEISSQLNFVGKANDKGEYPIIKGARFVIINSAAASFKNLNFVGASYIDVSRGTVLSVDNCNAVVEGIEYFDTMKREFTDMPAFIVSSSTLTPVALTLSNSSILSANGGAVNLRSPLKGGSSISTNTFGSPERMLKGSSVLSFTAESDAFISASGNVFYGNRAFTLKGKSVSPYIVYSHNNRGYGFNGGIFAGGEKGSAFIDSGSTVAEVGLQCANIANGELAFGGVDVTLNSLNKITAGKLTVTEQNINLSTLFTKYVVGSTLQSNVLGLYKDNVLYAYLNASADSESGYVVNEIG